MKCRKCGLIYLNPCPNKEEIRNYYPPWYHSRAQNQVRDITKTKIWGIPWRDAMRTKTAPILKHRSEGRILDVGCGDGSMLKYLMDSGWTVCGVELQETSARYARDMLGLNVFQGRLEDVDLPEKSFDVVTLFHVLEHLTDPSRTLKKARSLLKEDGIILVEVPNFASMEARIFGPRWNGIAAPLHLFHFTPETVWAMLKNCGFSPFGWGFRPEQARYAAGYSESLRYCLIDLGLYPSRQENEVSEIEGKAGEDHSFMRTVLRQLHTIEYGFFKPMGFFMDKIGIGSNLLTVAAKRNNSTEYKAGTRNV